MARQYLAQPLRSRSCSLPKRTCLESSSEEWGLRSEQLGPLGTRQIKACKATVQCATGIRGYRVRRQDINHLGYSLQERKNVGKVLRPEHWCQAGERRRVMCMAVAVAMDCSQGEHTGSARAAGS